MCKKMRRRGESKEKKKKNRECIIKRINDNRRKIQRNSESSSLGTRTGFKNV